MSTKVLIVDDVHEVLLEKLQDAGIAYDYQPDITRAEAEKQISEYSGLVIRSKFQVDIAFMDLASGLSFIARAGAGMDNIDEAYAASRNITLINAPEGNRDAVGEHMTGMLLSLMNNLNRSHQQIKNRQWLREENRGYELKGRTVALIGYGNNGQAMAKKLSGFDVNLIAYDKYKTGFSDEYAREVSMEEVVKYADVLSFHIPLTRETKGMVDQEYLFHFRKPIFFLMGARGGIVDIPAVLKNLDSGRIIAAAFDVLPVEKFPSLGEQPWFEDLMSRENVLVSPHVAGWTFESYYKLSAIVAEKIVTFLK
ncbi:NAD(P)-dependent oxidoreductase [Sphingobacterium spiritivorum]|uniref:NAD(P)-dependent oxidoreductase n=1 Tax=Sphingobacterium spiritivorum TaxID=258 RepID=UPI003DA3A235